MSVSVILDVFLKSNYLCERERYVRPRGGLESHKQRAAAPRLLSARTDRLRNKPNECDMNVAFCVRLHICDKNDNKI